MTKLLFNEMSILKKSIVIGSIAVIALVLASNFPKAQPSKVENQRIRGVTAVNFTAELGAVIEVVLGDSLLQYHPRVSLRPITFVACYTKNYTFLGHTLYTYNIDCNSSESIDLSAQNVDINVDGGWGSPVDERNFDIHILPKPGFTWGTVSSLDHLIIESK
jgi:hypothetical protein